MSLINRSRPAAKMIRAARSWAPVRILVDEIAGYRRVFPSLSAANAEASRFISASHTSDDNVRLHLAFAKAARPSDYPVLFRMDRIMHNRTRIFDLGGNVGNLFYCYEQYLTFGPDMRWVVHDLEEVCKRGQDLAVEKNEHRLSFTHDLNAISGSDVLLVSGSLHYFDFFLPDLIRQLSTKPDHVIINRTPLTDFESVVTIQDAGTYLVACKINNRKELTAGMEAQNYALVDSWPVLDLSIQIPFYPESSVREYSGLYFRLKSRTES